MRGLSLFALLLLLGLAEPAEAACSVANWRFVWGVETVAQFTSDGSACRTTVEWTTGTTEVHSVRISSPPRNGTALTSGRAVSYRPKAGFKGEDTFVFAISGAQHGAASRATVRVSVTVR